MSFCLYRPEGIDFLGRDAMGGNDQIYRREGIMARNPFAGPSVWASRDFRVVPMRH